ncbi:MAG: hypothetical protein HZC37_26725 [Burkholderiales bacterium]|nr:hypothetical protein [Burkholderiales bacterium]
MPQTLRASTARVIKKLQPQDAGARRWAAEFGDRLLCVRYRVDPQRQRRQTTVELVVEEAPTLASVRVGVRVAWAETQLRQRVKAAGGKWDASAALWLLPLGTARQLGLVDRVVAAAG